MKIINTDDLLTTTLQKKDSNSKILIKLTQHITS